MNDNEKQLDLRIRRTHKLLWDSLFELMTQSKQKYSYDDKQFNWVFDLA